MMHSQMGSLQQMLPCKVIGKQRVVFSVYTTVLYDPGGLGLNVHHYISGSSAECVTVTMLGEVDMSTLF